MKTVKRFPILLGAIFSLAILLSAHSAYAQADWQPITPEELKMTSAQAGNADAVILYRESTSDDVRKSSFEYRRIKILTESGKRYADVQIEYGKEGHFGTNITDVKARTISPDGKITPFSGQVFDKTVVQGHGMKFQAKSFTLPDVQVGSIIEWRYAKYWSDDYVVPARWIVQEDLAQKRVKFSYKPEDLSGVHEIQIGHGDTADGVYHIEIGLPKGTTFKEPRPGVMELNMTDVPAYEEEEFSPPAEMMKMRVYFYYGNRNMLKPEQFWKDEGKYWDKEVERFIGHSSTIAQAARQAVSDSDTPEQKARKLYAIVQKMSNLSYQDRSLFETLAEERKATKTAEQVLQQKTGTHNDLARLFVALARSLNISAYMMRVATREETFFQPAIPEWTQLNSEIAVVTLSEGKETFLDPGARFCPFGLLEWKRTAVQGVRQRPGGGTELKETPAPSYTDAIMQRVATLTLQRDGSLKGSIMLYWLVQDALQRRIDGAQTDQEGRKKAAEDELKRLLPGSAIVKLNSLSAWDDPDQPLKAVFDVELPGYAAATGKRLLLPGELFQGKQVFVHAERKSPVYFSYPYRVLDRVQITLPSGVQVENLPQGQPAKSEFALCSVQRTANGNLLEFRRDFVIGGISFPRPLYPELKSFFEKVHATDEEQVTLQTTPVAAQN